MTYQTHDPHPPSYQAPPRQTKGIGIAAMVLGIIAIVLSFIPVVGIVSFFLGGAAVILGIVALVKKNGKGQGIAGLITGGLSLLIAGIVTAMTGAFVTAVDESLQEANEGIEGEDTGGEAADEEEEAQEAQQQLEEEEAAAEEREEADPEDAPDGETTEEDAPEGSDPGTRENPLPLGDSFAYGDWEVTVNEVTFNADDQIAAENQFNDPAPEGYSYALINAAITYTGDDSESPALGTDIAYVTATGETISSWDSFAVVPDALDSTTELYNGGTESGNVALAIPEDGEGEIRVRLGFFDTEDAFFETQ